MAKPTEYRVRSLTDFTRRVEKALIETRARHPGDPTAVNWYRGSGMSEKWKLMPGLFRHSKIKDVTELFRLERKLLESFKRQAILYESTALSLTHSSSDDDSNYKYLFFMQHYGVPTRLLDWTHNPYMALYFALTSAPFNNHVGRYDEGAAVWILDPTAWTNESIPWHGDAGALVFGDSDTSGYAPWQSDDPKNLGKTQQNPVAIYGIANNTRMFAQKGVFTIFGANTDAMEDIYDTQGYPDKSLIKLVVHQDDIDRMAALVLSVGYTDSVSYPDLQGLATELKRLYEFKV
jgi:hypothetical protein